MTEWQCVYGVSNNRGKNDIFFVGSNMELMEREKQKKLNEIERSDNEKNENKSSERRKKK